MMPLKFTKMHGLGNDYIYVNTFEQVVDDAPALARSISDRHRGVGSDGLILIAPPGSADADVRMIMYNADGSRGEMCGNGIRCVAKYAYERGLARKGPLKVATDTRILTLALKVGPNGQVESVRVDMGEPLLRPPQIPVSLEGQRAVRVAATIGLVTLEMTCVSLGNPHTVIFVPHVKAVPLAEWGPQLERHALFPQRINVHFAEVLGRDRVRMITWERGSGATLACGSGATAVCVAGVLNGLTGRAITAELPGGELHLEWDEETNHAFMTGPATFVCDGEWLG